MTDALLSALGPRVPARLCRPTSSQAIVLAADGSPARRCRTALAEAGARAAGRRPRAPATSRSRRARLGYACASTARGDALAPWSAGRVALPGARALRPARCVLADLDAARLTPPRGPGPACPAAADGAPAVAPGAPRDRPETARARARRRPSVRHDSRSAPPVRRPSAVLDGRRAADSPAIQRSSGVRVRKPAILRKPDQSPRRASEGTVSFAVREPC